jgi:hypothetical protein
VRFKSLSVSRKHFAKTALAFEPSDAPSPTIFLQA